MSPSPRHVLAAVAWPYANGPRHIGHVAGFGVPSDVFARYHRMAGNKVLMVSGTDEHGTPRQLVDRYNRVIAEDLRDLGLSYDLFTRTTTRNHFSVVQNIFSTLYDKGYVVERETLSAVSPSTGRTLPDRYIEGTCPICGAPGARGDQCDTCGNQLDPQDLIDPRSKINGEVPKFITTPHFFLDLPAFAAQLGEWLSTRTDWRPNVLAFSSNLVADLKPRPISRDLDWGVPIPLEGWSQRSDKRLYVWFDAVIGYLSASVEWARRSGDPDAWQAWWTDPDAESYYFMGKDNVTFHSVIWPSILLGMQGGRYGELQLPHEVVSSEYLTMEGKKFSSSKGVVIYVRDVLSRYSPDALRYYLSAAGPESSDTDFTWEQFVTRNNTELVAGWGNLVNRTFSLVHKNLGSIPPAGALTDADLSALELSQASFATVGAHLERSRIKAGVGEAMRVVGEANRYLSEQEPWKLKTTDPERMADVLHVALQLVSDAAGLLTPFVPGASNAVHDMLGRPGQWSPMPVLSEVEDLDGGPGYPVLQGDYAAGGAIWGRVDIEPGTAVNAPVPLFTKLAPAVVDEELARLGLETQ
jgi:methionyl-tRNA synthetase